MGQFTGDLRGMALDKDTGTIYVADAEAAEIEEFQMDANPASNPPHPVAHWGSEGVGPGQFADGGRAITIDGDHDVWVADDGNFRFLRYSPDGTLIGMYPSPAQDPVAGGFAQVRDVAVAPDGSVWTADTWNNRFQRFAADGTLLGAFGHRNSHPPYGMDYPRGVAVDPANGQVWVSSTRDHFIRVYDAGAAHTSGRSGTAWTRRRSGASDGRWTWSSPAPVPGSRTTPRCKLKKVDTASGSELASYLRVQQRHRDRSYDRERARSELEVRPRVRVLLERALTSGRGAPADPDRGSSINPGTSMSRTSPRAGLPPTASFRLRFAAEPRGGVRRERRVHREWGTKGTGVFQLNQPSGLSHDAQGRIYVADAANDRVAGVLLRDAAAPGDATAPAVTLMSPAKNAVVPAATVIMTGTASDDVAVGSVAVSVHDLATNRWWNALDAVWVPRDVEPRGLCRRAHHQRELLSSGSWGSASARTTSRRRR